MFYYQPPRSRQLATLAAQVRVAEEATSEMLFDIVGRTLQRSAQNAVATERLHQLIEASALTQTALALIELELPQWRLRRVTYDEGEWHCALSRQRELPEWLDQAIEASHCSLTFAVVSVYIETLQKIEAAHEPGLPSVPQIRTEQSTTLCCENFA